MPKNLIRIITVCALAFGMKAALAAGEDPNNDKVLTLGVKYVELQNQDGQPVLNKDKVQKLTDEINKLYAPCKIQLKNEEYLTINPKDIGVSYEVSSNDELSALRAKYDNPKQLVVIDTGAWDHSTMGAANAWTAMPGSSPMGAVIEDRAADFTPIVAHELAHYLSLDHTSDAGNMMNPIVGSDNVTLDAGQCQSMRHSAETDMSQTLR